MIARTWHGRVPAAKGDAYAGFLERTGLADYARTPGYRGMIVQRRNEGDVTHFVLTTLWDSVEAIRGFAGDDYMRARYYEGDDDFLLEREPFVTHGEVLHATLVPDGAPQTKTSWSIRPNELEDGGAEQETGAGEQEPP